MPNSAAYMTARIAMPACTHSDGTVRATLAIATSSVCSQATCDGRSSDGVGRVEPHRHRQCELHDSDRRREEHHACGHGPMCESSAPAHCRCAGCDLREHAMFERARGAPQRLILQRACYLSLELVLSVAVRAHGAPRLVAAVTPRSASTFASAARERKMSVLTLASETPSCSAISSYDSSSK